MRNDQNGGPVLFRWIIGVVVPASLLPLFLYYQSPSSALQAFGGVMELLGILVVAYGFETTLNQYGNQGGPLSRFAGAIRSAAIRFWRWVSRKPPEHVNVKVGTADIAVVGDSMRAWIGAPDGAPLEKRIDVMEQNVEALRHWLQDVEKSGKESAKKLRGRIDAEAFARKDGDRKSMDLVSQLATEGIGVEAVGLWWFFVGVAAELASVYL